MEVLLLTVFSPLLNGENDTPNQHYVLKKKFKKTKRMIYKSIGTIH